MNETRWVLGIEYDGSRFSGWQAQAHRPSVQATVEHALAKIASQTIITHCAGRTDAGVHALGQVVHFDTTAHRSLDAWLLGGNSHLPDDVRILWVRPALAGFHARYSAIARCYRYIIYNRPVKSALLAKQTTWCYQPLDASKMHQAAQCLVGDHDFTSFRANSCQSKSPYRYLYWLDVYRDGDHVIMEIAANAFLHHMVRNIAGALIEIGKGKQPIYWLPAVLAAKNRCLAAMTAPPDGLYLASVYYPSHYGIPSYPIFTRLPADAHRFGD
jgi:tRNA pseudouridine38-40 synthase